MSHLLPLSQHVVGGPPPTGFDQLSATAATCGLTSSLAAANGFCWREQCRALPGAACPRQHLNFFPSAMPASMAASMSLPVPAIPVSSMSSMSMVVPPPPPSGSDSFPPSGVDWRQTLRSSIESRQHKMAKLDMDVERTSDHDSGNESAHSPATHSNSSRASHSPSAMTTGSSGSSAPGSLSGENDDTLTHSPLPIGGKKPSPTSTNGSSFLMNHILSKSSASPYERSEPLLMTSPAFYPFGMPFGAGEMCLPPYSLPNMGNMGLASSGGPLPSLQNYSPFMSSAFRPYPVMHTGGGMLSQPFMLGQSPAGDLRPLAEQQQHQPERSSPSSSASHSSSPCSTSMALPPNARENCIVCEDKASGFHYGVMSCEGCKVIREPVGQS